MKICHNYKPEIWCCCYYLNSWLYSISITAHLCRCRPIVRYWNVDSSLIFGNFIRVWNEKEGEQIISRQWKFPRLSYTTSTWRSKLENWHKAQPSIRTTQRRKKSISEILLVCLFFVLCFVCLFFLLPLWILRRKSMKTIIESGGKCYFQTISNLWPPMGCNLMRKYV